MSSSTAATIELATMQSSSLRDTELLPSVTSQTEETTRVEQSLAPVDGGKGAWSFVRLVQLIHTSYEIGHLLPALISWLLPSLSRLSSGAFRMPMACFWTLTSPIPRISTKHQPNRSFLWRERSPAGSCICLVHAPNDPGPWPPIE
jgi:hypothetical protein